jgi:hypothetical protein
VRLGVLGPAAGDLPGLARAAQQLLDEARVERVLYVGSDDALDRVVAGWARHIVGEAAPEHSLFDRAARRCAAASAEEIAKFVDAERARARLRVFASLPPAPKRTIELLDGRVVCLLFDKALLDEEDILGASVIVFGKSATPLLRRVGSRVFVAPGTIGVEGGGVAVLDDEGGGIRIELRDATGKVGLSDHVAATAKVKVQAGD